MSPIAFNCSAALPLTPDELAQQILDVANWPNFRGYGPIPGIKSAVLEVRTPNIVGTRIRVTNLDGSTHVEEIVQWQPDQRLQLRMHEFSAPVSRLATDFLETWEFQRRDCETQVRRSFELNAKSRFGWLALWMISFFLKRAVRRHLREMGTSK
ncbi:MAG: SRPBCC family protein [Pirellulaceae bacterium]|nr:SRPBCC family protein [Pirellulaceae bacterium]